MNDNLFAFIAIFLWCASVIIGCFFGRWSSKKWPSQIALSFKKTYLLLGICVIVYLAYNNSFQATRSLFVGLPGLHELQHAELGVLLFIPLYIIYGSIGLVSDAWAGMFNLVTKN
jgi:hypothetical protein